MVSEETIRNNKEEAKRRNALLVSRRKEVKRASQILSVYGVTVEEFTSMLEAVNHECEICGVKLTVGGARGEKTAACIDHCHTTGDIRGVLCRKCNAAIGALGDTTSSVRNAVSYLEKALVRQF